METAYILVSCEIGTENDLVKKFREFNEITEVMVTYGDYDIVVKAETENSQQMDNLLTTKIRRLEKIRSTITLRVTV